MTTAAPARKRGRPRLAADQGLTRKVEARVTLAQEEKFEQLGGAEWLRERIDKARVIVSPDPGRDC